MYIGAGAVILILIIILIVTQIQGGLTRANRLIIGKDLSQSETSQTERQSGREQQPQGRE